MGQLIQWVSDNKLAWWEWIFNYDDIHEGSVTREYWGELTPQEERYYSDKTKVARFFNTVVTTNNREKSVKKYKRRWVDRWTRHNQGVQECPCVISVPIIV